MSSAFPFEHFYGETRKTYVSGTRATTKQIFEKILQKRSLAYHSCSSPIYYSEKDTKMERNSIVYTFQNQTYKMYKINEIVGDTLLCNPQGFFQINFPETPEINWSEVGIFKLGGIKDQIIQIKKCFIEGKMIVVSIMLISCPINILREC